jgi:hypothetical protein
MWFKVAANIMNLDKFVGNVTLLLPVCQGGADAAQSNFKAIPAPIEREDYQEMKISNNKLQNTNKSQLPMTKNIYRTFWVSMRK